MKKIIKCGASITAKLSPELVTKILFKHFLGYKLNMRNPKTLNEKLQYLKLRVYNNDKFISSCVDKVEVRKYVEKTIGEEYLTKLYGVWENANNINYEQLPEKFVLKCNHGSGSNIICKNKECINIEEANKKLNNWMKMDFGTHRAELMYKGIKKKILCEEFIETSDGKPPKDYKFFCSYGNAKFLFVASDRYDNNTKFDFYDINWKWLPVTNGHPNAGDILDKPKNYDKMIEIVEKLSKPFPLVRVDLYNENGKIIFGELTFLHNAGLTPFEPNTYDYKFGKIIDIDVTKIEKDK